MGCKISVVCALKSLSGHSRRRLLVRVIYIILSEFVVYTLQQIDNAYFNTDILYCSTALTECERVIYSGYHHNTIIPIIVTFSLRSYFSVERLFKTKNKYRPLYVRHY